MDGCPSRSGRAGPPPGTGRRAGPATHAASRHSEAEPGKRRDGRREEGWCAAWESSLEPADGDPPPAVSTKRLSHKDLAGIAIAGADSTVAHSAVARRRGRAGAGAGAPARHV